MASDGHGVAKRGGGGARSLFLTAFGAVYVAAFGSYWLQYPGAFGDDGLLPVAQFWPGVVGDGRRDSGAAFEVPLLGSIDVGEEMARAVRGFVRAPCTLWFKDVLFAGVDVDVIMEGTALVGACCGMVALLGVHHVSVFALAFLCYVSCFTVGQTFLGFQWDIFLMETGASILLYAPWWSLKARSPQPAAAWVLRAQWVKFMFMSGVVKVTANCPTWKQLTALEYHFASTCLPTAEAWFHHNLPPFVLRLGIAVMFLLEIVAPWLLLVPVRPVRQVGVLVQVPFQMAIMLTGNYNWFNLHTMILLLPALEPDFDLSGQPLYLARPLLAPLRLWERAWSSRLGIATGSAASLAVLAWAFQYLFPITYDQSKGPLGLALLGQAEALRVENAITVPFIRELMDKILHRSAYHVFYASLGVAALAHTLSPPPGGTCARLLRCLWRTIVGATCVLCLGVTLLPVSSIHRAPDIPFRTASSRLYQIFSPFHVSNSYGLFRRMTGVGQVRPGGAASEHRWGGLPPSIVEVPAVVLEGSPDGVTWQEVPFRYAPYKPERAPRRTAPHQPRLDWQMWFAALGGYNHNPWFVHLVWKLLIGSEDVIDLLDTDEYPFKDRPPFQVRASLYHYDFTRMPTPWAERLPRGGLATVINCTRGSPEHSRWWARKRVAEYFPVVDRRALEPSAKGQGWALEPAKKSSLQFFKGCAAPRQRVKIAKGFSAWIGAEVTRRLCEGVMLLRFVGASVRSFVGFKVDIPLYALLWSGASTSCFLDGPMLAILGAVALPLCLRLAFAVGRGTCTCICRSRARDSARAKGKLKAE